jgi:hypothetical protein
VAPPPRRIAGVPDSGQCNRPWKGYASRRSAPGRIR